MDEANKGSRSSCMKQKSLKYFNCILRFFRVKTQGYLFEFLVNYDRIRAINP